MRSLVFPIIPILWIGWFTPSVYAQISPDKTLRNNSVVNQVGQEWQIQAGETVGNNLFHSLNQFNIRTGEIAYFINNNTAITNIITRVTGESSSSINGIIKADGTANIFLINPNGIIFGPQAQLNIGGSFLASTADSILFSDGSFFSATNPQVPPLLTVNVPLGLQFGSNPGSIDVSGIGHPLTVKGNPSTAPLERSSNRSGLEVKPGHTLALIGGDVNLNGGILTGERGRIELGSIANGQVTINPMNQGWILSYPEVENYGDIRLYNAALLDASGGSGIQIVGRQITMSDGSLAFTNIEGSLSGGEINLFASDLIDLSGDNPKGIPSGLRTQAVAEGNGTDITVSAPNLIIRGGASVGSFSFDKGSSGDINIQVDRDLQIRGASPFSNQSLSAIRLRNFGAGNGGNITILTNRLQLIDGGIIVNQITDSGNGGNISLKANDSVEIIGVNRVSPSSERIRSGIGVGIIGLESTGDVGNLTINTSRLSVRDGGRISTTVSRSGVGGNLTINSSQSIEVTGFDRDTSLMSFIASSALANLPIQRILEINSLPHENAGTVTINTPRLVVLNLGIVGVENQGFGNAGDLNITAGDIILARGGRISAATRSGAGGNINLKLVDFLLLRNGSQITAQAGGSGNGGNIAIDSPFIIAVKAENSDIIANAVAGNGGNINIKNTGIFGLVSTSGSLNNAFSEINASSQTGIQGLVTINNPEVDPTSGLIKLPEDVTDSTNRVIVGCAAAQGNSFTITGRGGLPEDPTATIRGQTVWRDWQDFSLATEGLHTSVNGSQSPQTNDQLPMTNAENASSLISDRTTPIVEATGWVINEQGNVTLVATKTNPDTSSYRVSLPNCHQLSSFGIPQS